jgi:ATP diphosphatase
MNTNKDRYDYQDLKALMVRLRSPDNGCPWDLEQTFETIKPHTIEEAYEVADAIERGDMNDLKDELGDLLFQVIFHAQMADENNDFNMDDIVDHIVKKMIFRHPHVFTDNKAVDAKDVEDNVWEQQKAKEKGNKAKDHYLDDVTRALPSLLLANKLQKRARKVGFEYPSIDNVFDKMHEELDELKSAIKSGNQNDIKDEYGDVLLVSALMGSYLKLNSEETLRQSCDKFIKRFNAIEDDLKSRATTLDDASIDDMRDSWDRIK